MVNPNRKVECAFCQEEKDRWAVVNDMLNFRIAHVKKLPNGLYCCPECFEKMQENGKVLK